MGVSTKPGAIHYSEVGRRQDALAPTEEAVRLYRDLAGTNPAFQPDLASALNNLGIRYSEVGRRQDALAPTEEAVRLYRDLAGTNPAFQPDLASALGNLGIRYSEVGRRQDALAPTEEAVRLYRDLAGTNPAFQPDLAMALNNLGVAYSEVGRRQDALAPTEEAVRLYRDLAGTNPAFQPDLASALNNLGIRYSEVGRRQDALTPTEEAVRLYRDLAGTNPAFQPDLASALGNLGIRYSEVGRRQDALAPTEEAVRLYRDLAGTNPALQPDLAMALNNLGNRCREAGAPDHGEAAWDQAITEAEPQAAAYLLVARAGAADLGHSAAVAWLVRALAMGIQNRGLLDTAHEQARRHRGPNPAAFDQNWARHTGGSVPAWLTVDPGLLSTAQAWVATDTYTAEYDYLAAHPELLEPAADIAVAEALLVVPEDEADRYTALRQAAQQDGVDAAYRPLLLIILAGEFVSADTGRQRSLLADRRDDLLTGTVADALSKLAKREDQQAVAAQRATALLDLARSGDIEPVFEALTEPGEFPRLLHTLAMRPDAHSVSPAAIVAYTAAETIAEAATALFYLAVGVAAGADQEQAGDLIRQARAADPAQVPAWINELAEIGQHHHGVLQLIPVLTAPADQPSPSEPSPGIPDDATDRPGGRAARNPGQHPAPGRTPGLGPVSRIRVACHHHTRRLAQAPGTPDGDRRRAPCDGVEPAGLMPDLHVLPGIWTAVKGYDQLLARLRRLGYREPGPSAPAGNLIPVAYDWRLSCRYNANRLGTIIEPALQRWQDQGGSYADARVVFVCHSMGGLIARWYIEKCRGADITRKLITLGTPYRGAARALGQLVNGAHPGLGPLRLDLTRFARSMPSLHQLLPEYAFIQQGGDLAKTTGVTLPELDTAMVTDAMRFYTELHDAEAKRPDSLTATHAIVGTTQPTATTARLTSGHIELLDTYRTRTLRGLDRADRCRLRADVPMDSNTLRRVPDKHGNLPRKTAALDEVEGILTAKSIIVKAAKPVALRVDAPDSRSPARPSPYKSRPPSPPGRRSPLLSPARRARSSRHALSAHPEGRLWSTGSRRARTASTSPAQTPLHRTRRSAATS